MSDNQKSLKNSLYAQLEKDLKKMRNREYVPVVLFENIKKEELKNDDE